MKAKSLVLTILILSLSALVLTACGGTQQQPQDGKYAEIAKCLTSKGVIFYGAFWCPHCQNQKKTFGDDMRYITYVECGEGGPNANLDACKKAGIERFPTWFFPGQGKVEGEQSPEDLAKKANCPAEQTTQQTAALTQQASGTQAPAAAVTSSPLPVIAKPTTSLK